MSYEYSAARKLYSGFSGYDTWMKTVVFDDNEVARYRLQVIKYYEQFGIDSTLSAYPVKRSTVFLWRSKLKKSKGKLTSLIPKSKRPRKFRRMEVHPKIVEEIARLRKDHYRLGKVKLKPLVDEFCEQEGLETIYESTIGKVVKRNNFFFQRINVCHDPSRKKQVRSKKTRVKRAPKPEEGGYIEADTVEQIVNGLRRYTISFIDAKLKIAYSQTFTGKLSKYTVEAFQEFEKLMPVSIHTVQTDNGSEFEGDFKKHLKTKKIKQVFTYPKCPKINGVIERYNRSVQEEWIYSCLHEMDDVQQFNNRLREYLNFYNNKRVHESLGKKTPASVAGVQLTLSPICV